MSTKPKTYNLKLNDGYIAITSAIIVTIIVISVVLTTSSTGYFGRFNILGTLLKEQSSGLSNACADTALLNLALDTDYAGNETMNIASSTCDILAIETNGTEKTIKVSGLEDERTTNIEIVLETEDFTIVSWEEVESF